LNLIPYTEFFIISGAKTIMELLKRMRTHRVFTTNQCVFCLRVHAFFTWGSES